MRFLKGLALTIVGFLLFTSLSLFGLAYWVNSTALNPRFVSAEFVRLDMAAIVDQATSQPADSMPAEVRAAAVSSVRALEPEIDRQAEIAIDSTYDYLLGKRASPELTRTLRQSFMRGEFVSAALSNVEFAPLVEQALKEQDMPAEMQQALLNTVIKLEPQIKQQAGAAAEPLCAYLAGETGDIDLADLLRETFLSDEFIISAIDDMDVATMARELISQQLSEDLTAELSFLSDYIEPALGKALVAAEPLIKQELKANAGDIADYLVGRSPGFSINIPMNTVVTALQADLKQAILASPPVEFAALSPDLIASQFEALFAGLGQALPSSVEINQDILGPEVQASFAATVTDMETSLADARAGFAADISEAENALIEARPYIGYFQLGYWLLIAFIALLIGLTYLLYRKIKPAARSVGITFLTAGILSLFGYGVSLYLISQMPAMVPDMQSLPAALQAWVPQLLKNLARPELIIGIVFAVIGAALIVFTMVYKQEKAALPPPSAPAAPQA